MSTSVMSPEEESFGPARLLLIGEPGAGKTKMAAQYPRPLFIETEKGAGSVKAWRLNVEPDGNCVAEVRRIFKQVHDSEKVIDTTIGDHILFEVQPGKKVPIQTIVLDTYDVVQFTQKRLRLGDNRYKMEFDDWGYLLEKMSPLMEDAGVCPVHVVFTAHSKDTDAYKDQQQRWVTGRMGMDLQGAIADKLPGWFDYILYIVNGEEGLRTVFFDGGIFTRPGGAPYKFISKDRHGTFNGLRTGGKPYAAYPMEKDAPSRKFTDLVLARHQIRFIDNDPGLPTGVPKKTGRPF